MTKNKEQEESLKLINTLTSLRKRFETSKTNDKQTIISEFEGICQKNKFLQKIIKERYPDTNYSNDIFEKEYFSYSLSEIIELLQAKSN